MKRTLGSEMKKPMDKATIIPAAATVTLPASDYYALVKLASDYIDECNKQLEGVAIEVNQEHKRVTVKYSEEKPFGDLITARVVALLADNKEAMRILVEKGEATYSPFGSWLYSYYDKDSSLHRFDVFQQAWETMEEQINMESSSETLVEEEIVEVNDER